MTREAKTPTMLEGQETLFDEKAGLSPVTLVEDDDRRPVGPRRRDARAR